MKRRELFGIAGAGAAGLSLPALLKRLVVPLQAQNDQDAGVHGHSIHHGPSLSGPNATAFISWGQWQYGLDRMDPVAVPDPLAPPPGANEHFVLPYEVTIKAGGSVVFLIAGFHQIIVYSEGTQVGDITPTNSGVGLIDYAPNRVYRGPSPALFTAAGTARMERLETVHFPNAGTHLVICGVRGHFFPPAGDDRPPMHGYVRVLD